jgi:hypothetical protein
MRVGNDNGGSNYYTRGIKDEVRNANTARNADWITAEYNNMKPSSTFFKSIVYSALASNVINSAFINGV